MSTRAPCACSRASSRSFATGVAAAKFLGGKAEIVSGFKVELINGFAFKRETVKIQSAALRATQGNVDLMTGQLAIISRNLGLTVADLEATV